MVRSVVLMYENTLHVLFDRKTWLLQWRTVAIPVNLAQASQSRLGEMKQGDLCTKSRPGDSLNFWASRQLAQARGISLKRDPVIATPLFLCSRLGEGEARLSEMSRLSETPQPGRDAGRDRAVFWIFDPSRVICFGWGWLCDDWHVYKEYFVCLAWIMNDVWQVGYGLGMRNKWMVWN